ncbi:hypothetical protein [Burkholderia multivorans]|nr:hypothetical protein [Burkholderia multivorans]
MAAAAAPVAVHEHDHFDYAFGLDEKLEHKPAMASPTSASNRPT